jgi:type III restriction enzyme
MRFTLKDYQTDAVQRILKTLGRSRDDWHQHQDRTAFALSATTGSGKTVIAATVIEALLHGSSEFDVDAHPSAVVLWVSKDPALNEQTRLRFVECADQIPVSDLIVLDKTYAEESLQTGTVYFINPDKLRDGADFVKHTDSRNVTFWEILANTVKDLAKTLYMVLDEAHEGMKKPSSGDQTIVQRIINGNGVNPAVPVVWGISATPRRFEEAMAKAEAFTKRRNVVIDPKAVQDSGLLKNSLTLDIPNETGDFETTMVRDATLDFVDVSERWAAYSEQEGLESPVLPLLVIQIPNKSEGEKDTEKGRKEEDELILRVLETVRKFWSEMPINCVAHVLGDRATVAVGAYEIEKVAPQEIQHNTDIRVLVAKDAVSTGWDCPRAEVLVSLRPGRDHTYVTQLLGRMVRTPLAQTTSEDRLNSAACYLPRFDKDTAKVVAEEIMGMREPTEGPSGPAIAKVLLKPVTLHANPDVAEDVWRLIEDLPSQAKPSATPKPIKRLMTATQALSRDKIVEDADKVAHARLFQVLDDYLDEHSEEIEAEQMQILTADVRRIMAERGANQSTDSTTARDADAATVEDALRHLRRMLGTKVANGYLSRDMQAAINAAVEAGEDPSQIDIPAIRARAAAIGMIRAKEGEESVQEAVEDAADGLVRGWLSEHKTKIKNVPDSRKPIYAAIQEMARQPEDAPIEIKVEEQVDTVDTDRVALPTAKKHVLSDSSGDFPLDVKLNRWERAVIRAEVAKDEVVGWYRNPSSASKNSLRIPYETNEGTWKSVQPDLIFVAKTQDGLRPSIIDPHGAHLGDALPKLKALARYAASNGDRFERIIAIGVEQDRAGDKTLIGLDLKSPEIQQKVYESAADSESVVALFTAHGMKFCVIPDER